MDQELLDEYNLDCDSWVKNRTGEQSILKENIALLLKRAAAFAFAADPDNYLKSLPGYEVGKVLSAAENGFEWVTASTGGGATKLDTPTLSATANSASQITLTLGTVENASGYVLQRATNSAFTTGLTTLTVSGTTYVNSGLSASTQYFYRLKATGSGYLDSDYATASATTQAANINPTVSLSLSDNEVIVGESVTLTATASDPDGTISKVEFYVDGSKVGEATSSPYTLAYTPSSTGTKSVYARAIDNASGATNSSAQSLIARPNYTQTVSNGETVDGVTLAAGAGTQLKFNDLPDGALPGTMKIFVSGTQVAQATIKSTHAGQSFALVYNGQTYWGLTMVIGNVNI